jgi:hypothetical protein
VLTAKKLPYSQNILQSHGLGMSLCYEGVDGRIILDKIFKTWDEEHGLD